VCPRSGRRRPLAGLGPERKEARDTPPLRPDRGGDGPQYAWPVAGGKTSKQTRDETDAATPPVRSEGTPRMRRASPKVFAVAGAIVVLAAVGVTLGVVFSGGFSGGSSNGSTEVPTYGSLANGLPGATRVNTLFEGIPQRGNVLGSPGAPVTMIEYVDLQCPDCREFETQVMPSIVRTYVRPGKLKVAVRPLASIGPDSVRGRKAMIAAGTQGKSFEFAEILYVNQQTENTGWLSDGMVTQAAESIPGLNVLRLLRDRNAASTDKKARSYESLASADQVDSTPMLFVGKSGEYEVPVAMSSPTDKATLVDAINAVLGE
jgi:protein-disulfide isomerase